MKTVTLIFPETYQEHRVLLPLALLFAGTPLKHAGYRVQIIDQRVEPRWAERLDHLLDTEDHVCVGISTMSGSQIAGALEAAKRVRAKHPRLPLVWGGVHPSLLPEQVLGEPCADIVVVGEGEDTLTELAQTLERGGSLENVAGIAYRDGSGKVVRTAPRPFVDLNALPQLDYDLVDIQRYNKDFWNQEAPAIALITSRGCPFPCTYCYEKAFNDQRWRALEPVNVVRELRRLHDDYDFSHFFFLDDEFFIHEKRVAAICDELEKQPFARSMSVHNANIRVDEINRYDGATLERLRDLGFQQLFVGVESGSNEVLQKIKKGITRDEVIRANRKLAQIGITPVYAFMAGFPFEREENVWETLSLMEQILRENPSAMTLGVSLFCPFPGTQLYDDCVQRGMVPPATLEGWAKIDYTRLNYAFFDPKLMQFFKYAAYFSFFMDGKQWVPRPWPFMLIKRVLRQLVRWRARYGVHGSLAEIFLMRIRDFVMGSFIRAVGDTGREQEGNPLIAKARAGA